ncbi:hypothetical protein [Agrobacterium tumefaciens]|uniref:Uncharacterized protein n=1 Tax=Agrobacterium tumefaciens TaxID=358 RepID=A0AA44F847_AGRTU|nr:hypothetical protein [Agrobacterium tumefaciens]NSL25108.1 hypothetical protein [Agrobacterium tumefaciens]NTB86761.1 hypothetical protein [Agrobacterium tumefaciens]NTC21090.1 hypothetical protein [Agrobacterium tumefaciens]NTC30638.1 hypothetical protein [Agrobacterium tumefaciens]NTC57700.1 hypothetical protein [Agrobacterium tumefaciens]
MVKVIYFAVLPLAILLGALSVKASEEMTSSLIECSLKDFERSHALIFAHKNPDKIILGFGGPLGIGKRSFDYCSQKSSYSPQEIDEAKEVFRGIVELFDEEFRAKCETKSCLSVFKNPKKSSK